MDLVTTTDARRALRNISFKPISAKDIVYLEFKKTVRMTTSTNNYYRVIATLTDGTSEKLAGSWGGPWLVALAKHLAEEWGVEPVWLDRKYISVEELWT